MKYRVDSQVTVFHQVATKIYIFFSQMMSNPDSKKYLKP